MFQAVCLFAQCARLNAGWIRVDGPSLALACGKLKTLYVHPAVRGVVHESLTHLWWGRGEAGPRVFSHGMCNHLWSVAQACTAIHFRKRGQWELADCGWLLSSVSTLTALVLHSTGVEKGVAAACPHWCGWYAKAFCRSKTVDRCPSWSQNMARGPALCGTGKNLYDLLVCLASLQAGVGTTVEHICTPLLCGIYLRICVSFLLPRPCIFGPCCLQCALVRLSCTSVSLLELTLKLLCIKKKFTLLLLIHTHMARTHRTLLYMYT